MVYWVASIGLDQFRGSDRSFLYKTDMGQGAKAACVCTCEMRIELTLCTHTDNPCVCPLCACVFWLVCTGLIRDL